MTELDQRLAFAVELAMDAGALAQRMRADLGKADAKSPLDFCTEADRAVERLIRARIATRYGDTMIGEEYGGEASGSVWVVDPIDGTTEYIHGTPRWCVSIAYMRAGIVQAGVIYAPGHDQLFAARAGGGAFLNGRRIAVSGLRHGAAPVVECGWSDRRPLPPFCDLVQELVAAGCEFRRRGSGALGLADVACGLNDGYVEQHINAWDVAAGILLVQEAGGWVNDFFAGDGLRRGNMVLAVTPEIRERLTALPSLDPHRRPTGVAAAAP